MDPGAAQKGFAGAGLQVPKLELEVDNYSNLTQNPTCQKICLCFQLYRLQHRGLMS